MWRWAIKEHTESSFDQDSLARQSSHTDDAATQYGRPKSSGVFHRALAASRKSSRVVYWASRSSALPERHVSYMAFLVDPDTTQLSDNFCFGTCLQSVRRELDNHHHHTSMLRKQGGSVAARGLDQSSGRACWCGRDGTGVAVAVVVAAGVGCSGSDSVSGSGSGSGSSLFSSSFSSSSSSSPLSSSLPLPLAAPGGGDGGLWGRGEPLLVEAQGLGGVGVGQLDDPLEADGLEYLL
ncbi:hypothetical protein LZ30DRAFT_692816 [Colletotrichum cereale]|nr:hypothetical protein LZ30DRAFT_692816 [Colletotrichum cereale]